MDVRTEPFEVSFDRTASFRGRLGNRPFVLIGEKGLHRLQSFRQMLGAAMTRRGLRRLANTNFTPHVTLLYDARSVDEYPIEPIGWTVAEFVLVRSLNGHKHLVRWPLWV
jgi:2'-5' RNA ligase